MPLQEQTNVRVPRQALDALARVAAVRDASRDETLRQLLAEHIARQEVLDSDDRLTHVATIMRYPPPLGQSKEKSGVPLRLRLPAGMTNRARAVSFRLPGQSVYRGHRDYQARLLTDAVMTAIAYFEPIADPTFDGIRLAHQSLRHKQALGLWRLVMEATRTAAECEIRRLAEVERIDRDIRQATGGAPFRGRGASRAELVAEVLERDVAWHGLLREEAVRFVVRTRLCGDDVERLLHLLAAQDDVRDTTEWDDLVDRVRSDVSEAVVVPWWYNAEGRGATVVWRAERAIDVADMTRWVRDSGGGDATRRHVVPQPGWRLAIPNGWQPLKFRREEPLPAYWAQQVDDGRVFDIVDGAYRMLWPIRHGGNTEPESVPGIDAVIAAAGRATSAEVIETLLLALPIAGQFVEDYDLVPEAPALAGLDTVLSVYVPAFLAQRFGFIDGADRDQLVAQAREATMQNMRRIIAEVEEMNGIDRTRLSALADAVSDPAEFRRLAAAIDIRLVNERPLVVRPAWRWPVPSLATEVADGVTHPEVLRWLTGYLLRRRKRVLERAMEDVWRQAFDQSRRAAMLQDHL